MPPGSRPSPSMRGGGEDSNLHTSISSKYLLPRLSVLPLCRRHCRLLPVTKPPWYLSPEVVNLPMRWCSSCELLHHVALTILPQPGQVSRVNLPLQVGGQCARCPTPGDILDRTCSSSTRPVQRRDNIEPRVSAWARWSPPSRIRTCPLICGSMRLHHAPSSNSGQQGIRTPHTVATCWCYHYTMLPNHPPPTQASHLHGSSPSAHPILSFPHFS